MAFTRNFFVFYYFFSPEKSKSLNTIWIAPLKETLPLRESLGLQLQTINSIFNQSHSVLQALENGVGENQWKERGSKTTVHLQRA